jgi:hypothetical protein
MPRRDPTDSPKNYRITHRSPSRAGRRLAAVAFVLALAAVAFAATVASLAGLAAPAPAPAAPTVTTVRHPHWCEISDIERCPPPGIGYEPVPAGPPAASSPAGGGR